MEWRRKVTDARSECRRKVQAHPQETAEQVLRQARVRRWMGPIGDLHECVKVQEEREREREREGDSEAARQTPRSPHRLQKTTIGKTMLQLVLPKTKTGDGPQDPHTDYEVSLRKRRCQDIPVRETRSLPLCPGFGSILCDWALSEAAKRCLEAGGEGRGDVDTFHGTVTGQATASVRVG